MEDFFDRRIFKQRLQAEGWLLIQTDHDHTDLLSEHLTRREPVAAPVKARSLYVPRDERDRCQDIGQLGGQVTADGNATIIHRQGPDSQRARRQHPTQRTTGA